MRDLVYYAGNINWQNEGVVEPPADTNAPDNPLAPVYDLLRVLKHDFDTVLQEREAMQAQVLQVRGPRLPDQDYPPHLRPKRSASSKHAAQLPCRHLLHQPRDQRQYSSSSRP